MGVMKAYRYRVYPSKAQATEIDKQIEFCRKTFNELLALKKLAHNQYNANLGRKHLYSEVKGTKETHSQVVQNVADRVDKGFRNFFRRVKENARKKGFPRYKKFGANRSITMPQVNNPENIGKKTFFPKVGWLNTKYHREITGNAKTLTIKKAKTGKYFATVVCANPTDNKKTTTDKEVGLDLGLNYFIATSDNEFVEHPKPLKYFAKKRKRLNRNFSKTMKQSKNRNKKRVKIAVVDERIINIRDDFAWKLSNDLVKRYGFICVEDLNIKNMVKNHCLAKSINDVSWGNFLEKLGYVAESAGGRVVKLQNPAGFCNIQKSLVSESVNPRNTSQRCSNCGEIVKKSLAVRTHKCNCGLVLDRDTNASLNILKLGQELSESKPVGDNTSTVCCTSKQQVFSMNQEAPSIRAG
ncbi:MAG: transposase [Candidatus Diapherotrites archaeon]|nr:transposase [Candidatus Diapherotrites archaeon]